MRIPVNSTDLLRDHDQKYCGKVQYSTDTIPCMKGFLCLYVEIGASTNKDCSLPKYQLGDCSDFYDSVI
jgi:hypothetical protein